MPETLVDVGKSPICSFSPEAAWTAIRIRLHDLLEEREWEMWVRHTRLMRFSPPRGKYRGALLICMPRNGRAIFGAQRYLPKLRSLAHRLNLELSICVELDDWQVERAREKCPEFKVTYLEPAPSELWPDWLVTERKAASL